MQYLNYQVDLNTINTVNSDLASVKSLNTAQTEGERELNRLKKQLEEFKVVEKFADAKQLAKKLFNIQNEVSYLRAGTARCTIISRADIFKIILDSDEEIYIYSFSKKRGKNE